jgi:hypothetical protein
LVLLTATASYKMSKSLAAPRWRLVKSRQPGVVAAWADGTTARAVAAAAPAPIA